MGFLYVFHLLPGNISNKSLLLIEIFPGNDKTLVYHRFLKRLGHHEVCPWEQNTNRKTELNGG